MNIQRLHELYEFNLDEGIVISRRNKKPVGSINKDGYMTVRVDGKTLYLHRILFIIANGYLPKLVDHIDENKCNNRKNNLRQLTQKQNLLNRSRPKGIYFNKKNSKWVAQISNKYLGSFASEAEALHARKLAVNEVFSITTQP